MNPIAKFKKWRNKKKLHRIMGEFLESYKAEQLLEALKRVLHVAKTTPEAYAEKYIFCGICLLVERELIGTTSQKYYNYKVIVALCNLFEGWPEHSGNRSYPISMPECGNHWEGEALAKRIHLMEYAIAKLEGLLK